MSTRLTLLSALVAALALVFGAAPASQPDEREQAVRPQVAPTSPAHPRAIPACLADPGDSVNQSCQKGELR
jgi:hypothetical protein